jgi:TM2 domain-containing membrane protein YozV
MSSDLFMDVAKGRFPLADTISSARFWTPNTDDGDPPVDASGNTIPIVGNYVTRPDRNFDTLQWRSWFGFLGLDHFYLRSPGTGIAKLLTLGGFGFWWVWDVIQLMTEKERVLLYGLSTPFDMQTGIGQGMIYEGSAQKWKYMQDTDFGTWSFASLFGFMGADMFVLGRFWLGFRKFIIFIITISALAPFMTVLASDGLWPAIKSAGFFGIFWDMFCFMLAIGVLSMWFGNLSMLFSHPDRIRTDGLPNSQTAVDALGWIKNQYVDENGNMINNIPRAEWETINRHYMIDRLGIIAQELRGRFWIAYEGEVPASPAAKGASPGVIPVTLAWRVTMNFFAWFYNLFMSTVDKVADYTPGVGSAKAGLKGFEEGGVMGALSKVASKASGGLVNVETLNKGLGAKSASELLSAATDGKSASELLSAATDGKSAATSVVGDAALKGGAREEPLSTEAKIMGAVVIALVAGGSLKGLVDYLIAD